MRYWRKKPAGAARAREFWLAALRAAVGFHANHAVKCCNAIAELSLGAGLKFSKLCK